MTLTAPHRERTHRMLVQRAIAVKTRLQFTGWLQYLPPAVLAALLLLLAGVIALFTAGNPVAVGIPLALALALLAIDLFDLATIKWGFRPSERRPPRRDDLDAVALMLSRRSCRSFQKQNLSDDDRALLLASVARHSGPGAQIGRAPVRFEYVRATLTVWPVVGAHEFLVAIAPADYDRTAVIDVGRGLQHVVLDATRAGIATCWIGPGAHHGSIIAGLGDRFDPDRDHIICVCAVGYRSRYLPLLVRVVQVYQHRRKPIDELFSSDADFTASADVQRQPYASLGRLYEACRWSPSSFNGQPTRAALVTEVRDGMPRLIRVDFASATASRYYAPVAAGIWCANWERGVADLGIGGTTAVLEHAPSESTEPPFYDISWIPDHPVPATAALD